MMRAGDVVIIALVILLERRQCGNAIGRVLTQFNYMPAFGVALATVMLVIEREQLEDNWERVASFEQANL